MDRRIVALGAAATVLLAAAALATALCGRAVRPEPGPTGEAPTLVTLRADGTLVLKAPGTPGAPLGNLVADRSASAATLARLREALSRSSRRGPPGAPEGSPARAVDVAAAATLSWEPVAWVLEAAASVPDFSDAFRLRLDGDPGPPVDRVSFDLYGPPVETLDSGDPAWEPVDPSGSVLTSFPLDRHAHGVEAATVLVACIDSDARPPGDARGTAFVLRASLVPVSAEEEPSGLGLETDPRYGESSWIQPVAARAMLAHVLGPDAAVEAYVLYAARPLRPLLTYGDVFTVARALRDLGQAPLLLRGLAREGPAR